MVVSVFWEVIMQCVVVKECMDALESGSVMGDTDVQWICICILANFIEILLNDAQQQLGVCGKMHDDA